MHAPHVEADFCCSHKSSFFPSQSSFGKPGTSAATRRSGTQALASATYRIRQTVLGRHAPDLKRLALRARDCTAGDRRSLASSWIQAVLEVDFAAQDERGTKNHK
jgi:hypothetical protein